MTVQDDTPDMVALVEATARRLLAARCTRLNVTGTTWDNIGKSGQEEYRIDARAAIAAPDALVETMARAMCREATGTDRTWRTWTRGAAEIIAAMQPVLDAAREAGRRHGWKAGQAHMQERAAETCDRLSYTPHPGASTRAAMCARQIRAFALLPPAPDAAPMEGGHGQ